MSDSSIKAIGSGLTAVRVGYPGTQDPPIRTCSWNRRDRQVRRPQKVHHGKGNDIGGFASVAKFMQLFEGITGDIPPLP